MTSHYAAYIRERTTDLIVENETGFATYRYLEGSEAGTVYVIDVFTRPEARREGRATLLADLILLEAKKNGCHRALATVRPSAKASTASLKGLLAYGMTLHSAFDDSIVFKKDI